MNSWLIRFGWLFYSLWKVFCIVEKVLCSSMSSGLLLGVVGMVFMCELLFLSLGRLVRVR